MLGATLSQLRAATLAFAIIIIAGVLVAGTLMQKESSNPVGLPAAYATIASEPSIRGRQDSSIGANPVEAGNSLRIARFLEPLAHDIPYHLNDCDGFALAEQSIYWMQAVASALKAIDFPILSEGLEDLVKSEVQLAPAKKICAAATVGIWWAKHNQWESFLESNPIPIFGSPWLMDACANLNESICQFNGSREHLRLLSEYDRLQVFPEQLTTIAHTGFVLRYWHLPANVGYFRPPPRTAARTKPLLYLKGHTGMAPNEQFMFNILRTAGYEPEDVTIIRADWSKPSHRFTPEEYLKGLQQAPFMLAYTPSDQLGNFILEARATDTPIFLVQRVDYLPLAFDYSAGACARDSWDVATIRQRFLDFVNDVKSHRLRPAHEVSTRFGPLCSARILLLHLADEGVVTIEPKHIESMKDYLWLYCYQPLQPRMCR